LRPGRAETAPTLFDHFTGRSHPKVPRHPTVSLRPLDPVAQRVESVPNPDIVGNRGDERDFLDEVLIGERVQILVVGILSALESLANDARDIRDRPDAGQRALEFPAHVRRLHRTSRADHWNSKRHARHALDNQAVPIFLAKAWKRGT